MRPPSLCKIYLYAFFSNIYVIQCASPKHHTYRIKRSELNGKENSTEKLQVPVLVLPAWLPVSISCISNSRMFESISINQTENWEKKHEEVREIGRGEIKVWEEPQSSMDRAHIFLLVIILVDSDLHLIQILLMTLYLLMMNYKSCSNILNLVLMIIVL